METSNKKRPVHPGRFPAALLFFLWLSACDTAISDYRPRTRAEQEILPILIEFQEAKNSRDIQRLMPLLHDEGEFTYACGVMLSKKELMARLPAFWAGLDNETLGTVPLAHECLNGDYYTSGILKEPVITVSGASADVRVWFTRPWWSSLLLFVRLVREEDRWLITRTWWGPS